MPTISRLRRSETVKVGTNPWPKLLSLADQTAKNEVPPFLRDFAFDDLELDRMREVVAIHRSAAGM
jgi:hypothetical protein